MKVGFVGLGKLGLPVALAIEQKGHTVFGWDINPKVRDNIIKRYIPYVEEGSDVALLNSTIEISDVYTIVRDADIIFISVQTPHEPEFEGVTPLSDMRSDFDYSYLIDAVVKVANEAVLQEKNIALVIISTVLPTTIDRHIRPRLNQFVHLAYNPAFIAMGTTMKDFLNPEFVLCGVDSRFTANKLKFFYRTITDAPFVEMNIAEAELTKVAYNTFIGMKIIFANTLMEICYRIGGMNVDVVTDALKMAKRRLISPAYLSGGMGDGGGCTIPTAIILGDNKPICQVGIGDSILSSDGIEHVLNTFVRHFNGDMYRIKGLGMLPFDITEEHPILTCKSISKKKTIQSFTSPTWVTVKELQEKHFNGDGHYLLIPRIKGNDRTTMLDLRCYAKQRYMVKKLKKKNMPMELPLNEDMAWIIGLYIAEGSIKKNRATEAVRFHLGSHEVQLQDKTIHKLRRLGFRSFKVVREITRTDIVVTSTFLARALREWCGINALNKKIPDFILDNESIKIIQACFDGYIAGDGYESDGKIEFVTISRILIEQLQLVSAKLGFCAGIRVESTKTRTVLGRTCNLHETYRGKIKKERKFERMRITDKFILSPIRSITRYCYNGSVYNIETDKTHSYLLSNAITHNCHPRDNIALSWLAREFGLYHDIFSDIMECREDQALFLAHFIQHVSLTRNKNLPIMILGYTFKPETNLTVGSPAILLKNLLKDGLLIEAEMSDPFVDDGSSISPVTASPKIFFIGTKHAEFAEYQFPTGSVVIDPFRYIPDQEGVEVIRIGA